MDLAICWATFTKTRLVTLLKSYFVELHVSNQFRWVLLCVIL
jgi:hypothetical protein